MEQSTKAQKILRLLLATGFSLFLLPAVAYVCDVNPSAAPFGQTEKDAKSLRDVSLCAVAQKMDVQGHRGIFGLPNNTLESFRAGYAAGSETVELDLMITSDDEILVAHDPTLSEQRCALKGGGKMAKTTLRKMTYQEASQVVCAEKTYSQGAASAPMPKLSEVFNEFKNTKTVTGNAAKLNIEIKYDRSKVPEYFPEPQEYVKKIVASIREAQKDGKWTPDRFFVQSFDHEILKVLKEQAPDIEVVPLVGDAKDSVKAAKDTGSKMVTPSFTQLTPEIMTDLRKMKVKTIPWTPNTEAEMMKVISLGVDGIITDRPDLFLKIRAKLCGQ